MLPDPDMDSQITKDSQKVEVSAVCNHRSVGLLEHKKLFRLCFLLVSIGEASSIKASQVYCCLLGGAS